LDDDFSLAERGSDIPFYFISRKKEAEKTEGSRTRIGSTANG
jgi:hypothetical protein